MSNMLTKFCIFSPLIFLFLQSMYTPIIQIPVYDIFIGLAFIVLIISFHKKLFIQIYEYKNNLFFKFLILYIFWVFLAAIIQIILHNYNPFYACYAILLLFLYNDILWFIYPAIIFPNILSHKTLIKYLLIAIYIICIYGLIIWVLDILNVPLLTWLNNIIVNRRSLFLDDGNVIMAQYTRRAMSVFEEPGYFGGFICINLPLIYKMVLSKYKILRNNFLDYLFKKSYIPIVLITIIAIQSPIWFIFSLLVTIACFSKTIFIKYGKITICSIFLLVLLIIPLSHTNISEDLGFFERIRKTYDTFTDFRQFVRKEPSLANRIISYIVRFKIFEQWPITGVGYKNTEFHAAEILYNIDIPLTDETKRKLRFSSYERMRLNGAILWDILSDNGLVGLLLFYSFIIALINANNKILRYMPNCIMKDFITGIRNSYICILCFSFYDLKPNFIYFWFLYGLTLSFIFYNKKILKCEARRV